MQQSKKIEESENCVLRTVAEFYKVNFAATEEIQLTTLHKNSFLEKVILGQSPKRYLANR